MPKRKKPVVRRQRRSPYERSLEYATNRLEKALAEQMHHQACLEALNQEIPYLQTVIRALTPPGDVHSSLTGRNVPIRMVPPERAITDQSEFLSRFVKPIPLTDIQPPEVSDSSEPFIPDHIPGEEVLP